LIKTPFFRRKLEKIAENCDHNVDPLTVHKEYNNGHRNAFAGLEENLRALVPTHETSKIVFGSQGAVKKFGRASSLIDQVAETVLLHLNVMYLVSSVNPGTRSM
jgi:hypothetical protein